MITLATLKDATAQEVFDQVVNHLRQQGERSENSDNCAYRGYNGEGKVLMCAAGCLIADDEYKPTMDARDANGFVDESIDDTTWGKLVSDNLVPEHHMDLIRSLQRLHDNKRLDFWEDGFKEVAQEYNLVVPA